MPLRVKSGLSVALMLLACTKGPAPEALPAGGIRSPLRSAALIDGQFVAYALYWEVSLPGGDPIVFRADGTVENLRAALSGTWSIANDSTLIISPPATVYGARPHEFRLRSAEGDLVSPPPESHEVRTPMFWIRRAGSPAP
jgi:hypothetical protein